MRPVPGDSLCWFLHCAARTAQLGADVLGGVPKAYLLGPNSKTQAFAASGFHRLVQSAAFGQGRCPGLCNLLWGSCITIQLFLPLDLSKIPYLKIARSRCLSFKYKADTINLQLLDIRLYLCSYVYASFQDSEA